MAESPEGRARVHVSGCCAAAAQVPFCSLETSNRTVLLTFVMEIESLHFSFLGTGDLIQDLASRTRARKPSAELATG